MLNIAKLSVGIRGFLITFGLMGLIPFSAASAPDVSGSDSPKPQRAGIPNDYRSKMARLRVPFIANEGQISAKQVKYYAKTFGGTLYVTERGELVYALPYRSADKKISAGWALKEYLAGDAKITLQAVDSSPTRVSYFKGDRSNWKSNIATYNELSLGEVYPGIHLKLKAYGKNVEKIFTVNPGTAPETIRLKLEGASNLEVNAAGELVAHTDLGPVTFSRPVAFQEVAGTHHPVAVAYHTEKNSYGFSVGPYDPRIPLVIDPLLASTYLGGTGTSPNGLDEAHDVAVDSSSGIVYVTGWTSSADFPTQIGYQNADPGLIGNNEDAFVSRFDSGLSQLQASTYLGTTGSGNTRAYGIAFGATDQLYITGYTTSQNFPVTGSAYDRLKTDSGKDVFVSRLNTDLDDLEASTYVDDTNTADSVGNAVVYDMANSRVYVCGNTASNLFPNTLNGYDSDYSGAEGFVARLDAGLTTLTQSTYLGGPGAGSGDEYANDCALCSGGDVYVVGYTTSTNFNTTGTPAPYDPTGSGATDEDVFVAYLAANLQSANNITLIAGDGNDQGKGIKVDDSNNVYIIGDSDYSTGDNYPVNPNPGAYQTTHGNTGGSSGPDVIVSVLNSTLSDLLYSTFIGGDSSDFGYDIVLDNDQENVHIIGTSWGGTYPYTSGAYDTSHNGDADWVLSKLNISLSTLVYSTFFGGSSDDKGKAIDIDSSGNFIGVGLTESSPMPIASYDSSLGGSRDAFVVKLEPTAESSDPAPDPAPDPDPDPEPDPTPPTVSSTSPSDGATNVAMTSAITATFSTTMDGTTITTSTFTVTDSSGSAVSGSVSYSGSTATFTPSADLSTNATYTATITTGAQDTDSVALASDHAWSFTTAAGSAPNTPSGTTPADLSQITGSSVTLRGNTFSDPDVSDTHVESQLRVRMYGQPYGKSSYDGSFAQTLTSENLTTFTVSGLIDGMKYYWQIRYKDSGGNYSAWSVEINFIVGTSIPDNSVVIGAGSSSYDFQMVSFGQFPDDPSVASVLGLSTPLDTTNYRIGTYDPLSGSYVEYGSSLTIEPGRGYWFLCRNGLSITVNGVPCTTTQPAEVELKYNTATGDGWNMIGPPNCADYTWSEVQIVVYDGSGNIVYGPASIGSLASGNPYINILLYRYLNDGLYYSDTTRVEQYKGFWVEVKQGNVYLRFTSGAQAARGPSGVKVMLADLFDRAHRWSRKWILATPVAMANGGGPPAPPGDFYSPRTAAAGGGGCFIATAAFGSPLMPHVQILRAFRDRFLGQNRLGNFLVKAYYRYSPPMAHYITQHNNVKQMVRLGLLPVVAMAWMGLKLGSEAIIALILVLTLTAAGFLFGRIRRG